MYTAPRISRHLSSRFIVFFALGCLVCLTLVVLAPAFARADEEGLVPCGRNSMFGGENEKCNACHLVELSKRVLDFTWYRLAIPLAAIMFAYGGVLMILPGLGGEKTAGQYTRGKTVVTNALIGLVIMFFAWIAVDTIILVLGGKMVANSGSTIQRDGFFPWNEITCTARTPLTQEEQRRLLCKGDGRLMIAGVDICDKKTMAFFEQSEAGGKEGASVKGKRAGTCSAATVVRMTQYDDLIKKAAAKEGISGSVDRVKAIGVKESEWVADPKPENDNDGRPSYGLMQIRPENACQYNRALDCKNDLPGVIRWLKKPENNIAVGVNLYATLRRQNSYSDRLATAAYNGGPKANLDSKNCKDQKMKRWECPWDNNEHSVANTGYQVTRDYISFVDQVEQKIKNGTCGASS